MGPSKWTAKKVLREKSERGNLLRDIKETKLWRAIATNSSEGRWHIEEVYIYISSLEYKNICRVRSRNVYKFQESKNLYRYCITEFIQITLYLKVNFGLYSHKRWSKWWHLDSRYVLVRRIRAGIVGQILQFCFCPSTFNFVSEGHRCVVISLRYATSIKVPRRKLFKNDERQVFPFLICVNSFISLHYMCLYISIHIQDVMDNISPVSIFNFAYVRFFGGGFC